MSAAGRRRAEEFSWPRVTAKVDDYYGFVIRRLAQAGALPAHFSAEIPPSPRAGGSAPHVPAATREPGDGLVVPATPEVVARARS
jgi:hypothetical protein